MFIFFLTLCSTKFAQKNLLKQSSKFTRKFTRKVYSKSLLGHSLIVVLTNTQRYYNHNSTKNDVPYGNVDYNYDALGNLIYRSDKGYISGDNPQNIFYDQTGNAGLHAVTRAYDSAITYEYDFRGNAIKRGGDTISYNGQGLSTRVNNTYYYYTASGALFAKSEGPLKTSRDYILYLGNGLVEKKFTSASGPLPIETKAYIDGVFMRTFTHANDSSKDYYFLKDHLGSIDTTLDAAGNEVDRTSFDAFGENRSVWWFLSSTDGANMQTDMSFTGHKKLATQGMIHMKGRVYDANVDRFLSADPYIQAPTNTQSYNRYSYISNNPLSYTDPSGYTAEIYCRKPRGSSNDSYLSESTACEIIEVSSGVSCEAGSACHNRKNGARLDQRKASILAQSYLAGSADTFHSNMNNSLTAIGGAGQMIAGAAAYSTGIGCVAGIPIIVIGFSNIVESGTGFYARTAKALV